MRSTLMIEIKTKAEIELAGVKLAANDVVATIIPAVVEITPADLHHGIVSGRFVARRVDDPRDVREHAERPEADAE